MHIDIPVPDRQSGDWVVQTFTISENAAKFENLRASFRPGGRYVKPGTFKRLMYQGHVIMSNTPAEIGDHIYFMHQAKGHVLINGLGLGVCIFGILPKPEIESITVIEISPDVISLVAPYINDARVTVIQDDALEYKPPKGKRYGAVWHDIWPNICADNLEEMAMLHRKYGKRTDWQGSWCKELCKRCA